MTLIHVTDENTGQLVEIDIENPTGTLYVIDADTGDLVPIDLSSPTETLTVLDANTGDFVDIDYSNPVAVFNVNDPNTGEIIEIDLSNPTGTLFCLDENTGDFVEVDLSTAKFIFAGGAAVPLVTGDTTARPTCTISVSSVTADVAAMSIVFSEAVQNFAVGDITISGGSLASFATADNITFTVNWTLAAGANTMDIAEGVCIDLAGNTNVAATQFAITYLVLQPDATAGIDSLIQSGAPDSDGATSGFVFRSGGRSNLLKFDLSSIPANSTIRSAVLTLTSANTISATLTVTIYRILPVNSAWIETCTWNYAVPSTTRWAGDTGADGGADAGCTVSGTDYSATLMGTFQQLNGHVAGQAYPITLNTAQAQAMYESNAGMVMFGTSSSSVGCATSDYPTVEWRPKIAIVYTNP